MTTADIARRLLAALRQSLDGRLTKADRAALAQIADESEAMLSRGPGRPVGTAARPREFDVAEAAKLRGEGLSFAEIGKRLNVSRQAIHAALRRAGGE